MKTVRHLLLFLILLCFAAGSAYAGWDIKVTSPNGTENWTLGSTHNITWTIAVPCSVKIELLQGGVAVGTIATVAQNQKTYAWEVGKYAGGISQAGTNYTIKITATNLTDSDTSDANFTIGMPLKVTSPNGGENWTLGSTQTITWTPTIPGSVKLELLQGDTVLGTIKTVQQNQTPYSWDVGKYTGGTASPGTNYKIKITLLNTGDSDTSDAVFTISKLNLGFQLSSQYLTNLITIINNYLNGTTTPTITTVVGTVTPGGFLSIEGQGFGNSQGKVKMFGEFPGGYVQLLNDSLGWKDYTIIASIPSIAGVKEQTVKIQVETADHKVSNEWLATFKPSLAFIYLPATALKNTFCDQQSDDNSCPTAGIGHSFYCVHQNCGSTNISGIDNWSTQLKNGWVIDGNIYDFQVYGTGSANTYNSKFTPHSTDLYLEVDFKTSCSWDDCTHIEVYGNIGIIGPKDVPCQ